MVIQLLFLSVLVLVSCTGGQRETEANHELDGQRQIEDGLLVLPQLTPVDLDNRPLNVIATTSIVGDVVANVAGTNIELLTLIEAGIDPHSFEPGAAQLTNVAEADVIFVNGWDLEEGLVDDLATIADSIPIVAVGANIDPLKFGNENSHDSKVGMEDAHDPNRVDPHTWFAVTNVEQWTENITEVLSDLDPANATKFEQNAQTYLEELKEVDTYVHKQIGRIPAEKRVLVTNHGVFNYFAQEYGFRVIGTVLPSSSTLAEPSAGDLAELVKIMEEENVCTIFTDFTISDSIAQTVAEELSNCGQVRVIPLYTGSLGLPGSGAENYTRMIKTNVDNIVKGLDY